MNYTLFKLQLKDDNIALQHVNEELQHKCSLSQEAITTNTISDRNIHEQQQAELQRVNSSLDSALAKLDRKVLNYSYWV